MTFNMVGSSTTPSKSKRNQLVISSKESDVERCSGLKEILINPEGIFQRTHIQIGAITPVDYNAPTRGIEVSDDTLLYDLSYMEKGAFAYIAETP